MLDERLSLAAALYEPCAVGADIGTDHALLPCHLLTADICRRMLLCDVSPCAMRHAEENVRRYRLEARVRLVCADGLDALDEPCGCVSIMGMGGETMAGILRRGQNKLHGAVLVLSAHTGQPLVRQAIEDIGYHTVREELCYAAGRYYVFWRAEEGRRGMSAQEIRYGGLLYASPSPHLKDYLRRRLEVAQVRLKGLEAGSRMDGVAEAEKDVAFYRARLEEIE